MLWYYLLVHWTFLFSLTILVISFGWILWEKMTLLWILLLKLVRQNVRHALPSTNEFLPPTLLLCTLCSVPWTVCLFSFSQHVETGTCPHHVSPASLLIDWFSLLRCKVSSHAWADYCSAISFTGLFPELPLPLCTADSFSSSTICYKLWLLCFPHLWFYLISETPSGSICLTILGCCVWTLKTVGCSNCGSNFIP